MTHRNNPDEIILPTFLHESEDASSNHHEARSIEDNDVLGDLRFITDASSLENVIPQDRMRDALDSYTFFSSRTLVQKPQKQVSNNELVSNGSSNSSESSADSVATLQTAKIKYHKRFSGVKQRAAAAISHWERQIHNPKLLPEQQTALFKENIHALLKKEDVTSADRVALMSSILPQYAHQAIPKHFIYVWTGKAIKPGYLEEIRSVAINSRAMGFRVLLYVTDPNLFLATQEQLSNSAKIPNLHIHNIQELTDFALDYFRDPNDFQNQALGVLLLDYLEREHIGLHNYGSYSDIIRLLALLKHGGYYLDTDTFITKKNTAKSEGASFFTRGEFKAQPSCLGLLYYFDERKAGNNVIASLQNHPIVCLNLLYIVKQYLEASDRQYYSQITTFNLKDGGSYSLTLALSKADLKRAPYNGKFKDKRGRVQLTINMTGPGSLNTSSELFLINQLENIITQNGLEIDLAKGKLSDLHRLERLQYLNDNFYKHSDSPDLFAIEMARPRVLKLGELEVHFEGTWYKKPSFQSFEC